MTPKFLREELVKTILTHTDIKDKRILDPAVGTGELLNQFAPFSNRLEGWDNDPQILTVAEQLLPATTKLKRISALESEDQDKYDLIVANPPYFQFKPDFKIKQRFAPVISGRANIFACFFQIAIQRLQENGWLAFIVPPSMNNGAYFQGLRSYIEQQMTVRQLTVYPKNYFDAQTPVQIILAEKRRTADQPFIFHIPNTNRTLFTENKSFLENSFQVGETLADLGFEVKTGQVVWNEHKQKLRETKTANSIPLIWSDNIQNNQLQLTSRKPQYIVWENPLTGPAIVCNRIIGSVKSGKLKCAVIPDKMKFVAENHINLITGVGKLPLGKVYQRLISPESLNVLRMITGNTQVSRNELMYMLPLKANENN